MYEYSSSICFVKKRKSRKSHVETLRVYITDDKPPMIFQQKEWIICCKSTGEKIHHQRSRIEELGHKVLHTWHILLFRSSFRSLPGTAFLIYRLVVHAGRKEGRNVGHDIRKHGKVGGYLLYGLVNQHCPTYHHPITLIYRKGKRFRKRSYGENALTVGWTSKLPLFWCTLGASVTLWRTWMYSWPGYPAPLIPWNFLKNLIQKMLPIDVTVTQNRTDGHEHMEPSYYRPNPPRP